jgi:hypothetical protein
MAASRPMCGDDDLAAARPMSTTVEPTIVKRIHPAVRRWPAALTLAILAPLIAELRVGSIPATKAWTLPFFGSSTAPEPCSSGRLYAANASESDRCLLSGWPMSFSKKVWRSAA